MKLLEPLLSAAAFLLGIAYLAWCGSGGLRKVLSALAYPGAALAAALIFGSENWQKMFWATLIAIIAFRSYFFVWDQWWDWVVWRYRERDLIVSRYVDLLKLNNIPDTSRILTNFPFTRCLQTLESENGYNEIMRREGKEDRCAVLPPETRDFCRRLRLEIEANVQNMPSTQANRYLEAIELAHVKYFAESYMRDDGPK